MNQTQAIAKLRKTLGPKFGYRVDPKAPDADRRAEIHAEWKAAKLVADEAVAARKARYEELLAGDATYQALKAKAADATKAAEQAGWYLNAHRITVGTVGDMFFSVKATGDNWAEVVAKASGSNEEPLL